MTTNQATTKQCTQCNTSKALSEFYVIRGRAYSKCKDCQRNSVRSGYTPKPTGFSKLTAQQKNVVVIAVLNGNNVENWVIRRVTI